MKRNQINAIFGVILIIVFFVLASYLVQTNLDYVKSLIEVGIISMLIYIFILVIAVVIAPISAMPLLPIASNVWGWIIAAILSIIGWTIGAIIAFSLARKYGVPLVKKFISLEKISKFEKNIPKENIFWSIIFLRMSIPVDILSYVLGLFSHIKFRTYLIATIIGITPFAFIFAYLGTLQVRYQIMAFLIAVLIILVGYGIKKKYKKKEK